MRRRHDRVEAFVSNVSVALVTRGWKTTRSARCSRASSTAPGRCSRTPRGSRGVRRLPAVRRRPLQRRADPFYGTTTSSAASKAVMETLCRYMSYRLFDEDVRVNVVALGSSGPSRSGPPSATGSRRSPSVQHGAAIHPAEEVASVVRPLQRAARRRQRPGDHGRSRHTFFDNLMRLYNERDALRYLSRKGR